MLWDNIISELNLSEEKIIKKDIIKTENFNIVLICIGKNEEISPHPEPYAVYFHVLEGSGIFTTPQGTFSMQKGSSIYYEKNELNN